MKRRSWAVAGLAGALSIALHAGGLLTLSPQAPQSLAGGPAQLAMIGNSFEDAVAGTLSAATEPQSNPPVEAPTDALEPVPPVRMPDAARPDAIQHVTPPDSLVAQTAPVPATPVISSVTPVRSSRPDRSPAVQPDLLRATTQPAAPVAAAPAAPARVTAREGPVVQTAEANTTRPVARPRAAATPERNAPTPSQHPAALRGDASETARAGDTQDATQGTAARTQQGQDGQSANDGRAAARYPQLINRHLSRLRRPNARFNGAAVVSFTISGNGGLDAVSVARSSGNAEFDRLALVHIRRAAPFPRPPAGAQRRFSVRIGAR